MFLRAVTAAALGLQDRLRPVIFSRSDAVPGFDTKCKQIIRETMSFNQYLESRDDCTKYLKLSSGDGEGDCINHFCTVELAPNFIQRYKVNTYGFSIESCDLVENNCTISFEIEYDGIAWIAVGFSEDGEMIGSDSVIGIPGQEEPIVYYLGGKDDSLVTPLGQQTLIDGVVEVIDGKTTMNFTKLMIEEGEINITATGDNHFLWAYGSSPTLGYHAARGSYVLNPTNNISQDGILEDSGTATSQTRPWKVHGWMGFFAWGVFVPLAIQASLFRNSLPTKGIWFRIHTFLNGIAYLLTLGTVAIAIYYVQKGGSPHFNGPHKRMGLAIAIVATVQVLGGLIRPPKPNTLSSQMKKSCRRIAFEICHRLLGTALLICGFWQIYSGFHLYDQIFTLEKKSLVYFLYWSWIVCLMGTVTFIAVYKRWRNREGAGRSPSWWHEAESGNLTEPML